MSDESPLPIRDHDLLIRLDQKVDALAGAVQRIEDNTATRLSALENDHVTAKEFSDHEKRIRFLERYQSRIVGGLAVVNLLLIALEVYLKLHH